MKTQIFLDGTWQLSSDCLNGKVIPAELPGDHYSALYENKIIPDPFYGKNEDLIQDYRKHRWTFTRTFDVPAELLDRREVWFDAEMVDTFAAFYLNGKKFLTCSNMFKHHSREIKKFLKAGKNIISVTFEPPEKEGKKRNDLLEEEIPMTPCSQVPYMNLIRKVHCHGGWDWGITLTPCGIYGNISITGFDCCRVEHLYTKQKHLKNLVELTAIAEVYSPVNQKTVITFYIDGKQKDVSCTLKSGLNEVKAGFEIRDPKLWWPNGLGEQNLYTLEVSTADGNEKSVRIGLRDLKIINEQDEYGKSMAFRVNGTDVFCKGADWIPADAFPKRQTRACCNELLESAKEANMNMLRVWGGGQYEYDFFYELCDEKGIMIWQDMMFSCSLYPYSDDFIEDVCGEVDYQIRRLRHHACIAIYCGDNEVIGATSWYGMEKRTVRLVRYDRVNRALQKTAAAADPDRIFWPSSPCGGPGNFNDNWHDDSCGDMHYWEVWHGGKSFDAYYKVKPRFCSEFGYQSFPSLETVKTYCPEKEFNVFSPIMEHHQKCPLGSTPIIGMFGNYFRMPSGFEHFLYLSQVQQALAIKTAAEYWRTLKPRCMGTIYWQLNDNWPVCSWSSIEYGGKWKQLQYHAKRFYAPVISAVYKNDQGNTVLSAVSDVQQALELEVKMILYSVSGKVLAEETLSGKLKAQESKVLRKLPAAYLGKDVFLHISLTAKGKDGAVFEHENTFFPVPYKEMDIEKANIKLQISEQKEGFAVSLTSDKPAFFAVLETPGIAGRFSDNSFTLLPGVEKTVVFKPQSKTALNTLKQSIKVITLRDTY